MSNNTRHIFYFRQAVMRALKPVLKDIKVLVKVEAHGIYQIEISRMTGAIAVAGQIFTRFRALSHWWFTKVFKVRRERSKLEANTLRASFEHATATQRARSEWFVVVSAFIFVSYVFEITKLTAVFLHQNQFWTDCLKRRPHVASSPHTDSGNVASLPRPRLSLSSLVNRQCG